VVTKYEFNSIELKSIKVAIILFVPFCPIPFYPVTPSLSVQVGCGFPGFTSFRSTEIRFTWYDFSISVGFNCSPNSGNLYNIDSKSARLTEFKSAGQHQLIDIISGGLSLTPESDVQHGRRPGLGFRGALKIVTLKFSDPNFPTNFLNKKFPFFYPKILIIFFGLKFIHNTV